MKLFLFLLSIKVSTRNFHDSCRPLQGLSLHIYQSSADASLLCWIVCQCCLIKQPHEVLLTQQSQLTIGDRLRAMLLACRCSLLAAL